MMFLCTLATKWAKITKVGGICLGIFSSKPYPVLFRDFSQKSDLLERHTPVLPYTASTPPPPPPGLQVVEKWWVKCYMIATPIFSFPAAPPPPPTPIYAWNSFDFPFISIIILFMFFSSEFGIVVLDCTFIRCWAKKKIVGGGGG